jgi:hypothetical protein
LQWRKNIGVQKKAEKIAKQFFAGVAKLAHPEHLRLTEQRATEMQRRILNSFASRPDGGELADGFVAVVNYFAGIGYWRGYKNARKHWAKIDPILRPPRGSKNVRLAIEKILEQQRNLSTKEVCDILDEKKLSESFELKKGRQRFLNVGPHRGGKVEHSWASVCRVDCVKRMISRIRSRLQRERTAEAWMKLADQALSSKQH